MISSLISGINFISLGTLFILVFLASFGFPGELVWIVYSGALANNLWELGLVILTTAVASVIGDLTAYELARKFSAALYQRLIKFKFFRNGHPKVRDLFKIHGFLLVFYTRCVMPGLGTVVNYISGFEKLNRRKFILAVVFGEILYSVMCTVLGFVFKETWNDLTNVIGDILVTLVLIVIIIFLIRMSMTKRRNKQLSKFV